MDRIINVKLLTHPINWLIVWVVLLFAGFAWHVVHNAIQGNPAAAQQDDASSTPFNANAA